MLYQLRYSDGWTFSRYLCMLLRYNRRLGDMVQRKTKTGIWVWHELVFHLGVWLHFSCKYIVSKTLLIQKIGLFRHILWSRQAYALFNVRNSDAFGRTTVSSDKSRSSASAEYCKCATKDQKWCVQRNEVAEFASP